MKKILILLFAIMIFGVMVSPTTADDEISVSFSSKLWSRYLGADGAIYHDEPVLQSDIFISLPKGFYFDIWHSVGLDDTDLSSNFGDEGPNFTLGWGGSWNQFGVDLGIAYIDGLPTFKMKQGDSLLPYVELNRKFDITDSHSLTPFAKLELLFPLEDGENLGDIFGGLKHNWQLSDKFAVNQKAYLLYDNSWSPSSAVIGGYNVDLSWSLHDKITFNPLILKATTPLSSVDDERKLETVIGVGFTFHF